VNCECEPAISEPFAQLACGDTVCGTQWADGGQRDTDWFKFATAGGAVTWTVYADMETNAHILTNTCPPSVIAADAGSCPLSVAATVIEGTHIAFIAPIANSGAPCGGENNSYIATLACVPRCFADLNDDDVVNVDDLLMVINSWGPCP
jgi:hypothetical protein